METNIGKKVIVRADSWVPSSSDVFAEDWELVTE